MLSRLKRIWELIKKHSERGAVALILAVTLSFFGPQLRVETAPPVRPSDGPVASSSFAIIVNQKDFQSSLRNALATGNAVIYLGTPQLRSSVATASTLQFSPDDYTYWSTAGVIDHQMALQVSIIADELRKLNGAKKPQVFAPASVALYNEIKSEYRYTQNIHSDMVLFPGEYDARLKELNDLCILRQSSRVTATGILVKTGTSIIVPYQVFARTNEDYISYYYPGKISAALASFKKSNADYQNQLTKLKQLRAEYSAKDSSSQERWLLSEGSQILSDQNILNFFYVETNDGFLVGQSVPSATASEE